MERPNEHNELDQAPTLRGLSKHDPFVVPDGFFDRFPQAVQQRIASAGEPAHSWFGGIMAMPPIRPIVGGIALVAVSLVVWMAWPTSTNTPLAEVTMNIEPEEILHENVDTELLFTVLDEDDDALNTLGLPADEDELLAYLENEDLPLDLLIEDL